MGCGSSAPEAQTPRPNAPTSPPKKIHPISPSLHSSPAIKPIQSASINKKTAVAFSIPIENAPSKELNDNLESILQKPLPKRLQHLTPLENAPSISKEELESKLKLAEMKRMEVLETRKLPGRKVSRRHSELLQARTLAQNDVSLVNSEQISDKLSAAERSRQTKLSDIQAKQKLREERGRRAREKAKRLKESGLEELNFEIEKMDDGIMDVAENSEWTVDNKSTTNGDVSSGYNSRDHSASTTGSQKEEESDSDLSTTLTLQNQGKQITVKELEEDDFFA